MAPPQFSHIGGKKGGKPGPICLFRGREHGNSVAGEDDHEEPWGACRPNTVTLQATSGLQLEVKHAQSKLFLLFTCIIKITLLYDFYYL